MHRHIIDNFSGVGSVSQRQKHHTANHKLWVFFQNCNDNLQLILIFCKWVELFLVYSALFGSCIAFQSFAFTFSRYNCTFKPFIIYTTSKEITTHMASYNVSQIK